MSSVTLSTKGLDALQNNLQGEMRAAIPLALTYLKELAYQLVVRMEAYDTFALMLSIYISSWGFSEYAVAVEAATEANQFNPTKWPTVRAAFKGRPLPVVAEVKPTSPDEGWLAVAAAHGIKVFVTGYVAFADVPNHKPGRDVPAKPVIHDTAAEGLPIVTREFQKAIRRALA